MRGIGTLFVLALGFYTAWALSSLDTRYAWLAWPFAIANVFSVLYACVNVVNGWSRSVPEPRPLVYGAEPHVGVIIPTCGESVGMILRTVVSVFDQDWPLDKLTVVVSDDGHDRALAEALQNLPVVYFSPPALHAPGRHGAAKAGNLNAALDFLLDLTPDVLYVETRDADDEVGVRGFLRHVVGQLEAVDDLAFVQTIKEAQVSPGDPFENRASMFYRGQMLARNAANAVFPCGSGLVWRRTALIEIGGFPTWNLVEDLQSGVEALRRGWRGMYLPIVGAVGQHAPQDIPNMYKQRGTWALDTVRLMVWGDLRGLRLRQRLHFTGMLLDALNAVTLLVYLPTLLLSLFGVAPIAAHGWGYIEHVGPMIVAGELWMLQLSAPFNDRRARRRAPLRTLWRSKMVWTGLTPVFLKATFQGLVGGPSRKPAYRVTRKEDQVSWYWRETLPQAAVVAVFIAAVVVAVLTGRLPRLVLLIGPLYWGGTYVVLFLGFLRLSWFGMPRPSLLPTRAIGAHFPAATTRSSFALMTGVSGPIGRSSRRRRAGPLR